MKGYMVKNRNGRLQEQVFFSLLGVKIHLGFAQYRITKSGKNWKDTVKERKCEIWEVEITPKKKVYP